MPLAALVAHNLNVAKTGGGIAPVRAPVFRPQPLRRRSWRVVHIQVIHIGSLLAETTRTTRPQVTASVHAPIRRTTQHTGHTTHRAHHRPQTATRAHVARTTARHVATHRRHGIRLPVEVIAAIASHWRSRT